MASSPAGAHAQAAARPQAHVPSPPDERAAWLVAIALGTLGVLALVAVLTGLVGGNARPAPAASPPPVPLAAALPAPGGAVSASPPGARHVGVIVGRPTAAQQSADARRFESQPAALIAARWMEGFYPIYGTAQETFAVNWLLLASIHEQESAFSTAPGTYRGLNFAHCCGGPMQFNVTNGPPSTWQLVNDSYIYGRRPAPAPRTAPARRTAPAPRAAPAPRTAPAPRAAAAARALPAASRSGRLRLGHDLAGDPVGGAGGAAEQAARELRAAEVQGRVVLPGGADAAVHGAHRARCQIERAAGHRAGGAGGERELVRRPEARPARAVHQRAPVR